VNTAGRWLPDRRLLSAAMLGVASGAILVPLNTTMLAVALPDVMGEFGLGANTVSSLVTLYLGAVAIALPIAGSIGDRFGHRRAFLTGVAGFSTASAVAALAPTFEILEAARVGQAMTGALISTSSAALVRISSPKDRQGEAFGLFDLLVSTSAAVGPFVGGLLVTGLGWRSLFVVAVPVGIVAAGFVGLALRPAVPGASTARATAIDVQGLALLAITIVTFLFAIRNLGQPTGTLAALALVPLLVVFVLTELRHASPAVDPRLLGNRAFAAALLGVFGSTVILHGSFIIAPLAVEELLGGSAITSGIALLGTAAVGALVAPLGGRQSDRRGRRLVVVGGSLVSAAGLVLLATPAGIASVASIAVLFALVGLGNGLTSPRQAAALEWVQPERVGMAAGTYYTGRYLGGVVGASLAGAILGSRVTAEGVSGGFAVLAVVGLLVAIASVGLPGRRELEEGGPPVDGLLPFR
jgi:EmrB/QacA subfamily drug resistance transporter